VTRKHRVTADDLDQDVRSYEEAFRTAVERSAARHDFWRDIEGIRIDSVSLDGAYPDTNLVVVFRSVTSPTQPFGEARPDCRFGIRWPIWPAESDDPELEAREHDIYFMEHLGTEPSAYLKLRGTHPCEPDSVNWLE
jgi:hypothetical protein